MAHWLMKTEPDEFSIADLRQQQVATWDGVRNYQARNFMRQMKPGDTLFIYHSSCKQVGIAGIAKVVKDAHPDPSQFDPGSPYHDPKSSAEQPRWDMVAVAFEEAFDTLISLARLKANPALAELALCQKGSRLSVMPVSQSQWQAILEMRR